MQTDTTNDIIQGILAFFQLCVLIVGIIAVCKGSRQVKDQIKSSEDQLNKQLKWQEENNKKEKEHDSRPIIFPIGDILNYSNGFIDWNAPPSFDLRNVGKGIALDVKAIIWGSYNGNHLSFQKFFYRHIDPISPFDSYQRVTYFEDHPSYISKLSHSDSIDGIHPLYDPYDEKYCIARLTITYRSIINNENSCYVSIFDHILLYSGKHHWKHVSTSSDIKKDIEQLKNE